MDKRVLYDPHYHQHSRNPSSFSNGSLHHHHHHHPSSNHRIYPPTSDKIHRSTSATIPSHKNGGHGLLSFRGSDCNHYDDDFSVYEHLHVLNPINCGIMIIGSPDHHNNVSEIEHHHQCNNDNGISNGDMHHPINASDTDKVEYTTVAANYAYQ